jgi:hypothetical protein
MTTADNAEGPRPTEPLTMTGSIAANFHEGSRSEYLAQYVFSSFGTAIPVPHQEDSGLDIYCTLLERVGRRAWPRAYYSVQVKSTMEPWVFRGEESVRWLIEHPLPIFLCIVQKSEARLLVYHTTPRFAAWAVLQRPQRLVLIPGLETQAETIEWATGDTFHLKAPILNFTIQQVLDPAFSSHVAKVLKFWIDYDVENLFRIKSGIPDVLVPAGYKTNSTGSVTLAGEGGRFTEESLSLARRRLEELLGRVTHHYGSQGDMTSAALYAMAQRHLCPGDFPGPLHNMGLHAELNKLFGMEPLWPVFGAVDSLLQMVKDELARHGIAAAPPSPSK